MENVTYDLLCASLAEHLGLATPLVSGNGARFKFAARGKATVYHRQIASGNQAEVAFEVESMALRLRMSQTAFLTFVSQLKAATGRPVEMNPIHNWPRVGVATLLHVALIREAVQQQIRAAL